MSVSVDMVFSLRAHGPVRVRRGPGVWGLDSTRTRAREESREPASPRRSRMPQPAVAGARHPSPKFNPRVYQAAPATTEDAGRRSTRYVNHARSSPEDSWITASLRTSCCGSSAPWPRRRRAHRRRLLVDGPRGLPQATEPHAPLRRALTPPGLRPVTPRRCPRNTGAPDSRLELIPLRDPSKEHVCPDASNDDPGADQRLHRPRRRARLGRPHTRVLPPPKRSSVPLRAHRARRRRRAPTANIGVVGLAVMGSNLARNLASREGNTVAIFNRSHEKTEHLVARAPRGGVRSGVRLRRVRRRAAEAAHRDHHGQGRRPDGCRDRLARGGLRAGRHHRRRRQRPLHRHDPPREGGARDRHQLRRRRHLRRRGGRAERPVDHARRLGRVVGHARTDPALDRRGRRGRAVRDARRPRRRRPLRQDGAQRHRVRRHAAHRRGVRPDPPRHRKDPRRDRRRVRRVEHAASSSRTSSRSPPRCCARSMPRPASRSSTSSSTRPAPRAPARGRCRPRSTWASPCRASPRRPSPARCPATPSSARSRAACPGPAEGLAVEDADAFIEDVRLALFASKIVAYSQGFDEIRAGAAQYDWTHRPRRGLEDLARRLHHPGAVPQPHRRRLRRRRPTSRCC